MEHLERQGPGQNKKLINVQRQKGMKALQTCTVEKSKTMSHPKNEQPMRYNNGDFSTFTKSYEENNKLWSAWWKVEFVHER